MRQLIFGLMLCLFALNLRPAEAAPNPTIERALDATVMIFRDNAAETFLGSGFFYESGETRGGMVMTNAHVVGNETALILKLRDGTRHSAQVLAWDTKRDIAVLQTSVARPGLRPTESVATIGDTVLAIGAPLGIGFTVTRGMIAADPRQIDPTVPLRFLQHDAAINPGSSGGPLIDENGRLQGMNSQIADGSRLFVGVGYAIAAQDLSRLVPPLVAGTLPPVPMLDLSARAVTRAIARALEIPHVGLLVNNVSPGGAAERAGIKPGDVISAVAGQPLTRPYDLIFLLEARAAMSDSPLTLLRDGRAIELTFSAAQQAALILPDPVPTALRWSDLDVTLDQTTVTSLPPDGLAAKAGLLIGDRLLRANGQPLGSDPVAPHPEAPLLLLIERDARHTHLIVDPKAAHRPPPRLPQGNILDLSVRRF